jgi:LysR family transcriptional regulator, low CO2-responsive transcriptional regulator
MNIKQLEAFVLIAEHKSFTQAAKLLYMTQPGISFQIKALESLLEVTLFERLEKRVILTEAGELLYPEARKILAANDRIAEALEELRGIKKGKVRLGASNIPGDYLMPKFIGEFKRIYPGINLLLSISDTGKIIKELLNRELDIGIIGAKQDNDLLEYYPFMLDQLIIISSNNHPQLTADCVSLEEILNHTFVMREQGSGTRMVIENYLAKHNIQPEGLQVVMELGSTRSVITAVEANLGISIVSKWAVQEALKLNKVKEIKVKGFNIERYLYIAVNKAKYFNHASKEFLNYLLNNQSRNIGGGE